MRTANIVAAMDFVVGMEEMDVVGMEEDIGIVMDGDVIGDVPTHRSASLERTVHLEVERTVEEIRPVSSVLLESSRQ